MSSSAEIHMYHEDLSNFTSDSVGFKSQLVQEIGDKIRL